jgi:hypothetical protein
MRAIHSILLWGVAIAVTGCSIHPLPQDVTPDTTLDIVNKIRCEARDAVEQWAAGANASAPPSSDLINFYMGSGIAFDFELTMSELNESSLGFGFKDDLGNGNFGLGLGGAHELKRKNKRAFQIVTTFGKLRSELSSEFCRSASAGGENFRYPITGRIGLDELITTFLSLAEHGGLKIVKGNQLADLTDTLTFETKVGGGIDPVITLTPITTSFHLSSVLPHHKSERSDSHEVAVGLTLPTPATSAAVVQRAPRRGATTSAEERALRGLQLERLLPLRREDLNPNLLE